MTALLKELRRRFTHFDEICAPDAILRAYVEEGVAVVDFCAYGDLTDHSPLRGAASYQLEALTRRALRLPRSTDIAIVTADPEEIALDCSAGWQAAFDASALTRGPGHANRSTERPLWRVDATGRTTQGNTYALRYYRPGSHLVGPLRNRDFVKVFQTSSLRVRWLRTFARVANELQLTPDQVDMRRVKAVARRGWRRTTPRDDVEVRLAALADAYREAFHRGRADRLEVHVPRVAVIAGALGISSAKIRATKARLGGR